MLIAELQNAVVAKLQYDAWFSMADPACPVVADNRGDLKAQVDAALGKSGVILVVEEPSLRSGELPTELVARFKLTIVEHPPTNRAKAQFRTAAETGMKAMALLMFEGQGQRWQAAEHWTPFTFERLEPGDESEEGHISWELEFTTETIGDVEETLLADHAGRLIATDAGENLEVSPDEA